MCARHGTARPGPAGAPRPALRSAPGAAAYAHLLTLPCPALQAQYQALAVPAPCGSLLSLLLCLCVPLAVTACGAPEPSAGAPRWAPPGLRSAPHLGSLPC